MTGKTMELGPTGDTARGNVARFRKMLGLSYAELSRRLEDLGRPIPPLGLRRIESGERRIDIDDLMVLSIALNANPFAILVPSTYRPRGTIAITGYGEVGPARDMLNWIRGYGPDPNAPKNEADERARFYFLSNPRAISVAHPDEEDWVNVAEGFVERLREWDEEMPDHSGSFAREQYLDQLRDDTLWASMYDTLNLSPSERGDLEDIRHRVLGRDSE